MNKKAKLVFFGTPQYVIPVLDALKEAKFEIVAVVTQPGKAVGRKREVVDSAVSQWANIHDIPVLTNTTTLPSVVVKANVGVLAAYGKIISKEVIAAFPKGIVNIHPSLLPQYRGASPVAGVIAAGEKKTGVTIIRLDEEMDHGPILSQFEERIKTDDTRETLRRRLFKKAVGVLPAVLDDYLNDKVELRVQEHAKASFTTLIKKEHGFIPPEVLRATLHGSTFQARWQIPFIKDCSVSPTPEVIERFIRAVDPWPGAWTHVHVKGARDARLPAPKRGDDRQIRRLKILGSHLKGGRLELDKVQLEGKNPVSWEQFKQGYPDAEFKKM